MSIYLISLIVLLVILLIYLRLAKRYKIFDIPNNRSSHKIITIRGGGIVFPISLFIYFILSGFEYPLFMLGILIISIISFMDDIKSLQPLIRLPVQIIVVLLVLFELFSEVSLFYFLIVLFIMLGGLNAYNFMDGINGMTASYSLVILSTLYYINESLLFVDPDLIIFPLLSVLVFLFFNFRVKAICFSGDVGSLSLALLILFLLFKLIIFTGEPLYALLLIIYAVDSGLTLINRKLNGENVFKPHRSHLYQQLVHLKGYSHLNISLSYSFIQLVINYLIIFHLIKIGNSIFWLIVLTALSIFMYNLIKNILNER